MRLRATRQSAISHPGRRGDPYGRQYLLDAASGMYLPGFTYTRSGPALWLPQQDGSLASFAADVLPRSFGVGGWGYEFHPGWTQLWPNANDLSLRSVAGLNPIVASGTGPGVGTPAWALIENTTTGAHNLSTNLAYTAGVAHTVSAWARERQGSAKRYLLLVQTSTAFASNLFACFDLATGASVASAGVAASMEQLKDGCWRCNMTATASVTATSNTQVRLANSFAAATSNYTGDGASGLDVWCVNTTNTGYPVPLTINDANPGIIGNHAMTAPTAELGIALASGGYAIGCESVYFSTLSGSSHIARLDDGSEANRALLYRPGTGTSVSALVTSGNVGGYIGAAASSTGTLNNQALRVQENASRAAHNGSLGPADDGATALPIGVNRVAIGHGSLSGNSQFAGSIRRAYLIPRAPSDAELAAMTA